LLTDVGDIHDPLPPRRGSTKKRRVDPGRR